MKFLFLLILIFRLIFTLYIIYIILILTRIYLFLLPNNDDDVYVILSNGLASEFRGELCESRILQFQLL